MEATDRTDGEPEPDVLAGWLRENALIVDQCRVTSREKRAPHFEVVTVHARRPSHPGAPPA